MAPSSEKVENHSPDPALHVTDEQSEGQTGKGPAHELVAECDVPRGAVVRDQETPLLQERKPLASSNAVTWLSLSKDWGQERIRGPPWALAVPPNFRLESPHGSSRTRQEAEGELRRGTQESPAWPRATQQSTRGPANPRSSRGEGSFLERQSCLARTPALGESSWSNQRLLSDGSLTCWPLMGVPFPTFAFRFFLPPSLSSTSSVVHWLTGNFMITITAKSRSSFHHWQSALVLGET